MTSGVAAAVRIMPAVGRGVPVTSTGVIETDSANVPQHYATRQLASDKSSLMISVANSLLFSWYIFEGCRVNVELFTFTIDTLKKE